jgi:16S rRNA (uracil1498-N3)-methyltransferase
VTPLPRFHVPGLDAAAAEAGLPREEALHLTRVMRLGVGDEVAIFDGRGHEFRARVVRADRDDVRVELGSPLVPAPEAHTPITLVQAILKGDRMDDVVRDATMMGVAAIAPIVTARTIAKRQAVERWERVAVSSAKQCRRAVVPRVAPVASLQEWLASPPAGLKLLLVEPTAAGGAEKTMRNLTGLTPASVAIVVGPEGGWAPEERDALVNAGSMPVTLSGLTLRADAVPVVAISLVRFALADL